MKWVWIFVTILLAVTGVVGGYHIVEAVIRGLGTPTSIAFLSGIAILCLIVARMTYAKAKSLQ